jgi:hypothetical protein
LVRTLVNELADEEEAPAIQPGSEFPVWTPLGAEAAADVLLQALREKSPE